jgi:hypothetical protein
MALNPAFLLDGHPLALLIPFAGAPHELDAAKRATQADALRRCADLYDEGASFHEALDASRTDAERQAELARIKGLAEGGNMAAAFVLGKLHLEGDSSTVAKDELKGLDWLIQVAAYGFPEAQTLVGHYYRYIAKQSKKALPYLYAAAQQGDERGQVLFADCLDKGVDGVLDADALEAIRYFRRATEGTSSNAFHRGLAAAILADKYAEGKGVKQDIQEAIRWNRLSLEWKYFANRVGLIKQLKQVDATAHAAEIRSLTDAALKAGDKGAQSLVLDEEWNQQLGVWAQDGIRVDFWTRRLTYTGSQGSVMHFKNAGGHEIKVTRDPGGRELVLNPGQEAIVVYAGASNPQGDATGFAYRIFRPGMIGAGDGENIATLSSAIGAKEPPKYLLGAVGFGALLLFFGGISSFVGLVTAAGSGYVWFQGRTKTADLRQALSDHFDKIGNWVARLT